MNRFKLHLELTLTEHLKALEELNIKIDALPKVQDINLEEYGRIRDLKNEYKETQSKSILKKLFGPTKEELKKYYRTKQLNRLITKKNEIEKIIEELKQAIGSIQNNRINNELNNTNYIIKELLNYAITYNLTTEETTKMLLEILRKTLINNNVDSSIKKSIISFYTEDNQLQENTNINTLRLIYEKLFLLVLSNEELSRYSVIINGILIDIKLLSQEEFSKEELKKQKYYLSKLQQYITNGKISKISSSIEEFNEILNNTNLDENIKETLTQEMANKIEEKRKKEEEKKTEETLRKYLSDKELSYITEAKQIALTSEGKLQVLLKRLINDVVSISKYIDMVKETSDINDSLDILTKRINTLKEVLKELKKDTVKKSNFTYLIDNDYIPYILRTIESKDITELPSIFNLLNKLAHKRHSGILLYIHQGINIFKLSNSQHTLVFARNNDRIVIIDIYGSNTQKKDCISKTQLKKLQEQNSMPNTVEYQKLNTTYEELIVSSLNPTTYEVPFTLKKER